jgi:hypothetical protein
MRDNARGEGEKWSFEKTTPTTLFAAQRQTVAWQVGRTFMAKDAHTTVETPYIT